MKRHLVALLLVGAAFCWTARCGGSDGGGDGKQEDAGDAQKGGDGSRTPDGNGTKPSPAFRYNSEVCKVTGHPRSAVTAQVEVTIETLDAYAVLLTQEGFEAFRGPAAPPPVEDVVPQYDIRTRESVGWEDLPGEDAEAVTAPDVPEVPEVVGPPPWTGGQYVIARTPLSDMIFLSEGGVLGVASWCPAHNLGQVRRLDYALADAVHLWGKVVSYDYSKETGRWVKPVAFYTEVEGSYQRTYVNESLDINEPHGGQLSISGKPVMTAFCLYGHADTPSAVGDVVGVDKLQVGQAVIAENDTVTVSGQVVRLWDLTPFVGEGENGILVDPFINDASINFLVGVYVLFADGVFPASVKGSFVLNLQGAPPGKLLVSKAVDSLQVPPREPLF